MYVPLKFPLDGSPKKVNVDTLPALQAPKPQLDRVQLLPHRLQLRAAHLVLVLQILELGFFNFWLREQPDKS